MSEAGDRVDGPDEADGPEEAVALALAQPGATGSLAELVEQTHDEVTLGSEVVPDAVFSEVLAEAQAAVNGSRSLTVRTRREDTAGVAAPTVTAAPAPASRPPDAIAGLRQSLIGLGVPSDYVPAETELTLDGLVRELGRLPMAPPLPGGAASLIVVVGTPGAAMAAARCAAAQLELADTDVLRAARADLSCEMVARRRMGGQVTILVVGASLRSRTLPLVGRRIERLRPDFVLGAVAASAKRADVTQWHQQLGRVDALALSGLSTTTSPAELLGAFPVAFADGAPASALRWTQVLLGAVAKTRP